MQDDLNTNINYVNTYSRLSHEEHVLPNLPKIYSHLRKRYECRFNEEFLGSPAQTYDTIKFLVNEGCSEFTLYELIDWFVGYVMKPDIPSIILLKTIYKKFEKFREQHKRELGANDDWYVLCRRLRKELQEKPLDDMLEKMCVKIIERRFRVD